MSRLKTNQCLYINEKGAWCNDENAPIHGEIVKHRVDKTFFDVCFYYANMIDYTRILMTLVALALIIYRKNINELFLVDCCIGSLIFGSVLLDAVDGYVARRFHQSTVMGKYNLILITPFIRPISKISDQYWSVISSLKIP